MTEDIGLWQKWDTSVYLGFSSSATWSASPWHSIAHLHLRLLRLNTAPNKSPPTQPTTPPSNTRHHYLEVHYRRVLKYPPTRGRPLTHQKDTPGLGDPPYQQLTRFSLRFQHSTTIFLTTFSQELYFIYTDLIYYISVFYLNNVPRIAQTTINISS